MNDLSIPSRTMSSREIAELTGKQHAHVIRDIRNMVEKIEANPDLDRPTKSECRESTYRDAQGKERTEYLLNHNATLTLVSGYDVVLRDRIVTRWSEIETGAVQPAAVPAISLLEEQERRVALSRQIIDIAEILNDDLLLTLAGDNIKNAFGALLLPASNSDHGLFQIHEVLEQELGMTPAEVRKHSATIGKKVGTWYRAQGKSTAKTQRYIDGAKRVVNAYPAADRAAVVAFIRSL